MKTAIMIGDSHSQLVFPFLKDRLPFRYEEITSKPGWGIAKYLQDGNLQDLPTADVAIIALGGNNRDMNLQSYGETLERFLDLLSTKVERVVWIGPYHSTDDSVNDRHNSTNLFLKMLLPVSVGYVDVYDLSKNIPKRDKVHFDTAGYKDIVSKIEKKVKTLSTSILPRVWLSHQKVVTPLMFFVPSFMLGLFIPLVGGDDG